MSPEKINSIDDFERFLTTTLEVWSPDQRTAFSAAMAERWLPAYDVFSKVEQWGDPASLHQMVEAAWDHLGGHRLSAQDAARYIGQLKDSTPHMDDFDANQALAACVMLDEALSCCARSGNLNNAVQAALSGFEAVLPDWEMDIELQPRLWKQVTVRKELRMQLWLVERIGAISQFDQPAIQALREDLSRPEHAGNILPYPPPRVTATPPGISNQTAFEQYRRMVEADLRSKPFHLDGNPATMASLFIAKWLGRYSRRRQTIDGSYGKLADAIGMQALMAQARANDLAVEGTPIWDQDTSFMINIFFRNPYNGLEVRAMDQPHSFGPSLRRLWVEAKRSGLTDQQAWQQITYWARRRPAAWEIEDRRKKKGKAYTDPALRQSLAQAAAWSATGDVDEPWAAKVNDQAWRVRLGDFPDDYLYYLVIDGETVGGFHDWPQTWQRD